MLLKVVIVEDEEIIRKGLTFALNWLDMGCIIVGTAKDGAEGLETIRREDGRTLRLTPCLPVGVW